MIERRKARVAVVGTGWWSTYTHIPGLQDHPAAELVALCDIDEERLRAAARYFHVSRVYTDVHELLNKEDLDGVVVAVNHTQHYAVARACLAAGLHVMIEKPMVLDPVHGRDLLDLAERNRVEIIVGYPWHYTRIARRAREVIASGVLGAIQFVSSLYASMVVEFYRSNPGAYRSVLEYPVNEPDSKSYSDVRLAGGGQGHLQVTHSAGLLFWVTGLRASHVTAFMANFDVPVDMVDSINVRFDSGAVGMVGSTGNIGSGDKEHHDLRIYCANGYVLLDMIEGTLFIRHHNGEVETMGPSSPDEHYPRFATTQNLVDVILGNDQNHSSGEVGLRCVEFLHAAYRSASDSGQPIGID